MNLNNRTKVLLIISCFALSVVGFMMRLPSSFRHIDKELHSIFYFCAAGFLNLLFAKKNIIRHVLIFISLYFFSVAVEYAQEYSNKLFHKRIHGRYDIEDVQANLKGLVLFSILWFICIAVFLVYKNLKFDKIENSK